MQRNLALGLSILLLALAGLLSSIYEPKMAAPPPQDIPGDSIPLAHSSQSPAPATNQTGYVQEMLLTNQSFSMPPTMIPNVSPHSPAGTNLTTAIQPPSPVAPPEPPPFQPTPPKNESQPQISIYASGTSTNKDIAITFDDGPHPTLTYKALDELRSRNIKATFFVLGNRVKQYPWILQQTVAEGHDIGNHSWSHPLFTALSDENVDREINDTQTEIRQTIGRDPVLFRPPYGALSHHSKAILQDLHLNVILWSVDPRDWQVKNEEKIFNSVTNHVRGGSIILLHDIHSTTIQALPRILDALTEQGYHFKTVSELCGIPAGLPFPPPAPPTKP